jgi:uncharacterized protein YggE
MRSVAGLLVALSFAATPAVAQAQQPPPGPPVIVTHGEAKLKRAPDQAWVNIAAETRATAPSEAQRLAAEAMKSVQSSLAKAGLAPDAIRTTGYSLQPDNEYVNGRARLRGYIVRNQIEVRVDDLQKLGAVLDAAGTSGATSMAGLRFDLKDRAAAEREAMTLAVRDAMARARALAAGASVTLGPIIRIDESGDMRPPPAPMYSMARAAEGAATQTPISPGEIEITANVTLTVRIGG